MVTSFCCAQFMCLVNQIDFEKILSELGLKKKKKKKLIRAEFEPMTSFRINMPALYQI